MQLDFTHDDAVFLMGNTDRELKETTEYIRRYLFCKVNIKKSSVYMVEAFTVCRLKTLQRISKSLHAKMGY